MKENNVLSQEEIDKIANSVDIVDFISSYIPLTKRGKNFFGLCPFHADHSPSMSVSKEKQIYKCFSCGASGNIYTFLMEYENMSFIEALKKVATIGGIHLKINSFEIKKNDKLQVLYDIFETSQKFYKNNINTKYGEAAVEFIKNRHFSVDIIKEFGIGLSLKNSDKLTNLLLKKNFKHSDMVRSGLVSKSEKGYKDTYINRIMFPINDLAGKLVGYSGRVYDSKSPSKYFNIKETEIFKKGEILYNYDKAKDKIKEKRQVIVVEGFFALIRLHTIGVDNVIATLGTAFTKKHAMTIKRLSSEVILCFDGDDAGNEATNSCINELSRINVIPKIIRLEDNLDPDDYILKYGKNRMIEKIKNAMTIMDYKLSYYKANKDLSNNQDLSQYVNEILEELKKIDDDIYRELTIKKLSDITSISPDIIKNKLNNTEKDIIRPKIEITNNIFKKNRYDKAEDNLLYYMLNSKEVVKIYNLEKPFLNNSAYRNLALKLTDYLKKYGDIKISNILTYFKDDEEVSKVINDLLSLNLKDEFKREEIYDYIALINEKNLNLKIKKRQKEIKENQDKDIKKKLLEEIIYLKRQKVNGDD